MNKWEDMFYVATITRQINWGDHPRTGEWTEGTTVFYRSNGKQATKRFYSREVDARRGAAQMFRRYMKKNRERIVG